MQRREAKIGLRDRKCLQRRKERNDTNENLHRNGLFGVGAEICGLGRTGWWCAQSDTNRSPLDIRLRTGNLQNSANNRLSLAVYKKGREKNQEDRRRQVDMFTLIYD